MFVSLVGSSVDSRHPRVHVPAFADSYLPAVTVSLNAGLYTYKPSGADGPQRTLFGMFVTSSPVGRRPPRAFGFATSQVGVYRKEAMSL
jgi:hypothetical protein